MTSESNMQNALGHLSSESGVFKVQEPGNSGAHESAEKGMRGRMRGSSALPTADGKHNTEVGTEVPQSAPPYRLSDPMGGFKFRAKQDKPTTAGGDVKKPKPKRK